MSYREGQFHIKQIPHLTLPTPWAPTIPCYPIPTHPLDPHNPLEEFCVQFWSLFLEQDHIVSSNSIRETMNLHFQAVAKKGRK